MISLVVAALFFLCSGGIIACIVNLTFQVCAEESKWSQYPSPDKTHSVTERTKYGVLDSSLVSTSVKGLVGVHLLFGGTLRIEMVE